MRPGELEAFRAAVRERVCSVCLDRRVGGGCSRPPEDPCALESHLEQVVEGILSVAPTDDVHAYVRALRGTTCTTCRQDEHGRCELRDLVACSLDSYVLHVVDVIETVAREQRQKAGA